MSLSLKSILTLFITVLVFSCFFFLAGTGLSDFVQTRFYNPSLVSSIARETARDADIVQAHIFDLQKKFRNALNEQAVLNSFLYNQNPDDIFERSKIFGLLLESVPGLQYAQFVDMNGIRLHYSSSSSDTIIQNNNSSAYRNYSDDDRALPYDQVGVGADSGGKYTMDEERDRIIFSFPFTDSMDVYRGTALFTVSVRAFTERLISEGRINAADDVSVVSSPPGIVFGRPEISKSGMLREISRIWSGSSPAYAGLTAEDSGLRYALITVKNNYGLYYGRLVEESIFNFPPAMIRLLLLTLFFTLYLTLFFILNFRLEPVTEVKNRIGKLRAKLIERLYFNKNSREHAKWFFELEQRRDDIRKELKAGLKFSKRGANSEENIDSIINESWDEFLTLIKSGINIKDDEEQAEQKTFRIEDKTAAVDEVEELEELDEAVETDEAADAEDEVEELEEFDEAADAEDEVEELEELDEAVATDEAADEITEEKDFTK